MVIVFKVLPFAKNAIKQIASSDIVKDTAKQLTKRGTEGALNIAADLIEGKDPSIKAREKLQDAKNDIAKVIRKRTIKRKINDEDEVGPVLKKYKKRKVKRKDVKFNIFKK